LSPEVNSDCIASEWSQWANISETKQERVRRILAEPGAGGKQCPQMIEGRRMDSRIEWLTDSERLIKYANDCYKNGYESKNIIIASEDCGPACHKHHGCTHFEWRKINGNNGTCILKSGSVSVRDFIHISFTERYTQLCGFIEPIFNWNDTNVPILRLITTLSNVN